MFIVARVLFLFERVFKESRCGVNDCWATFRAEDRPGRWESCLFITDLSMSTIWDVLDFHFWKLSSCRGVLPCFSLP